MLSLIIPTYEPTNTSYIRNAADTGIDTIFVSVGFLNQRESVTKTEAAIGIRSLNEFIVSKPMAKFIPIKTNGQKQKFAHFLSSRFINTISRKIPTKLGTAPPGAERQR